MRQKAGTFAEERHDGRATCEKFRSVKIKESTQHKEPCYRFPILEVVDSLRLKLMKGQRTIHHRGMTLIELLVVIAIVGILAAMLLPATSQALERAKRTVCQNNLRQTYLMVASHASDHGGLLPAAWVTDPGQPMRVIASRAFGEPDPKSLHCPSDRRRFEPPLFDLSYYWNAQSLGQPLASLHPQLHLATEKWFWHDRKPPKPIGESSTYQGQGVALWADGSIHYQYLGLNTLTNETETLEE